MEKLQIAIEKARRQRGATVGRARSSVPHAADNLLFDSARIARLEPNVRDLHRSRIVTPIGERQSQHQSDNSVVEAFRVARTHLLQALEASGGRVVVATSAVPGEGKSLVTLNLAIGLARHPDFRVLLIDADLRHPSLAKVLGVKPEKGLSDYLRGEATLEQSMVDLGIDKLLCIPQTKALKTTSELLSSKRMADLIEEIRTRFPNWIILIDSPPILAVDDTLVLRQHADGCLLIAKEGTTRRADLRRAAELIGEKKFLGTILNFSNLKFHPSYTHQYKY